MANAKTIELKKQLVSELAEEFRNAETLIVGQYGGLTVADDTEMRADMRANHVTYRVVKNSLASFAVREAGFEELEDLFVGRTVIAYSNEDVVAPARLFKKYADQHEEMQIKGGIMEGAVAELDVLQKLAAIPDYDTLIAQVVRGIAAPLTGLAIYLDAIRDKMEEAGAETAAEVYEGKKDDASEEDAPAEDTSADDTEEDTKDDTDEAASEEAEGKDEA